ncbi:MAG: hypothetical protein KME50_17345 [Nostoc desertorum CM1-VF14]|nr:hypothetical protein [Nostoc desertorum CM1-VF14]
MQISYEHDCIKQVGSQLWRELSQVAGEEVCKKYPMSTTGYAYAVRSYKTKRSPLYLLIW